MNLFTVVFVILLTLKLIGTISVSWWVVFSSLAVGFVVTTIQAAILAATARKAARAFDSQFTRLSRRTHKGDF